jgi:hypothetical protein
VLVLLALINVCLSCGDGGVFVCTCRCCVGCGRYDARIDAAYEHLLIAHDLFVLITLKVILQVMTTTCSPRLLHSCSFVSFSVHRTLYLSWFHCPLWPQCCQLHADGRCACGCIIFVTLLFRSSIGRLSVFEIGSNKVDGVLCWCFIKTRVIIGDWFRNKCL